MPQNLYILLFFFFFTFSFLIKSDGADDPFPKTCPANATCNGVPIRYPFWLQTDYTTTTTPSQKYCGYPDFGIKCEGGVPPILKLSNDEFYVNNIDNNCNLTLVDIDVFNNKKCPRVRHNTTELESLQLAPTLVDSNLTFYFNCSTQLLPSPPTIQLDCLSSESIKSYVVEGGSSIDDQTLSEWYKYCEDKVEVAVNTVGGSSNFNNLGSEFGRVLNQGLVLGWQRLESCRGCENSRGRCGYDNVENQSLCFCSDGNVTYNKPPYCKGKKRATGLLKVGIGLGASITTIMLFCLIYSIIKCGSGTFTPFLRGNRKFNKDVEAFIKQYGSSTPKRYSFSEVKKITNSFNHELGKGGYGNVFKGKLSDGRVVAVKVLNETKGNGEEFINEVASIGRTSHVNVVTLLGFCFEGRRRALIYEFMPNGSLEKFIYKKSSSVNVQNLGLEKLYNIALGIARGLEYLHRGCNTRILHFDIKPHNILLNDDFCPKISDFGLAKLYTREESIVSMLQARGTIGYIAPEVFCRNFGGVSHKSDVYSYGMMILEMVGGRTNVDAEAAHTSEIYFPHWIYKHLEVNEEISFAYAMSIEENEIARKMVIVGLWCIQTNPSERPAISKVIDMLEGSMAALEIPPKPYLCSPPRAAESSS